MAVPSKYRRHTVCPPLCAAFYLPVHARGDGGEAALSTILLIAGVELPEGFCDPVQSTANFRKGAVVVMGHQPLIVA